MEKYPKIFVVVLNYNGKRTLMECLRSVFDCDYSNFEVVLVDNNSTDGSFETAKTKYPKIHFIKNSKNIGFGAGNNIGIRFSLEKMADFVFLLNNDAYLEKSTLSILTEEAQKNPSSGILNPLILNKSDDSIWFSGGNIDWLRMRAYHLHAPQKALDTFKTAYATGCAMLVKKDVYKKIGLFDENFFLYYEDADFSVRAKRKGFTILVVPRSTVWHDEQSTNSPQKLYWLVLSGILFFKKNMPACLRPWFYFYLWIRKMKNILDLHENKNNQSAQKIARAFLDAKKYH
ncbi:MAG: Glycosyl transferase family protein [Candidatus Berkelbacteria bacterium Athens1014_28]|uniref:Glycosyl transferase family protein n=1 Tax=Candidatus Berkelbacteria bacterium Athens1014_28 TaxID=2017145 RepID=A0A554LQ13_9BACT|nr:MAG: Glycosyl transferase family protein [Candidatus Berkelbacteria bacterium Athens1014_28]